MSFDLKVRLNIYNVPALKEANYSFLIYATKVFHSLQKDLEKQTPKSTQNRAQRGAWGEDPKTVPWGAGPLLGTVRGSSGHPGLPPGRPGRQNEPKMQ